MAVEVRRRLIDAVAYVVALRLCAVSIRLAPGVKNVPEVFAHFADDGPPTLLPLQRFVILSGDLAEVVQLGIDWDSVVQERRIKPFGQDVVQVRQVETAFRGSRGLIVVPGESC